MSAWAISRKSPIREAARGAPRSAVALIEVAPATATAFTSRSSRKPSRLTKRVFSSSTAFTPTLVPNFSRNGPRAVSSEIGSAKVT